MKIMKSVLLSSVFLVQSGTALAKDDIERTEHEAMARDIYANVISFRTARGHGQVPAMVNYLSQQLQAAGFSSDDIVVTDYDSDGEATQGMIVYYRSPKKAPKAPYRFAGSYGRC